MYTLSIPGATSYVLWMISILVALIPSLLMKFMNMEQQLPKNKDEEEVEEQKQQRQQ